MKIEISNLKEGTHFYEAIEDWDSLSLGSSEMFPEPVAIKVFLTKMKDNFYLDLRIRTTAYLRCDRCAENFFRTIDEQMKITYSFDTEFKNCHDPYFLWLSPDTQEIDLNQDLRDVILLAIPMKVLCSETCRGLCPGCGVNLNYETCCCSHEIIDPRWEVLKTLIHQNG